MNKYEQQLGGIFWKGTAKLVEIIELFIKDFQYLPNLLWDYCNCNI